MLLKQNVYWEVRSMWMNMKKKVVDFAFHYTFRDKSTFTSIWLQIYLFVEFHVSFTYVLVSFCGH
jgi:hypothetical protein